MENVNSNQAAIRQLDIIRALNWAITSEQAVTWRPQNTALIQRWQAIRDDLRDGEGRIIDPMHILGWPQERTL